MIFMFYLIQNVLFGVVVVFVVFVLFFVYVVWCVICVFLFEGCFVDIGGDCIYYVEYGNGLLIVFVYGFVG